MTNDVPTTPPPQGIPLPLTPEQIRRFELNRLKAKRNQQSREEEAAVASSSRLNNNKKRPLEVDKSDSPTRPNKSDSRLAPYYEYNLSKMVNSKGGFLLEDGSEIDEEAQRKEKELEKKRAQQNLEPAISLDPSKNPQCSECNTIDIDHIYNKIFGCRVCKRCQDKFPEKYSLLTKSECKEDYLLTDPELRDHELLPHLLKANPHSPTYANMMLFLRFQVEEFAWKKWGSPEALDAEYEKRATEKKKKKNKKFEQSLRDLRRRTKEGVWQRRKDEEHVHVFGSSETTDTGETIQVCESCGFTLEYEEL